MSVVNNSVGCCCCCCCDNWRFPFPFPFPLTFERQLKTGARENGGQLGSVEAMDY